MRQISGWIAALAFLGGEGCSMSPQEGRIEPREWYSDLGTGNGDHPAVGELAVRTLPEPSAVGQGSHLDLPAGYCIYDPQGVLVKRALTEEVTLPEGRYLVRLEKPTQKPSTFWVRVEPGKLTEVDLNKPLGPNTPTAPSE